MTHLHQRRAKLPFGLTWAGFFAFTVTAPAMGASPDDAIVVNLPGGSLRPAISPLQYSLPPAVAPALSITAMQEGVTKFENAALDSSALYAPNERPSLLPVAYGPQDATAIGDAGTENRVDPQRFRTFGSQVGAIKWEVAALFGYYTLANSQKIFEDPTWPHFQSEGWFGKNTSNLGVDKLAHTYSAYIISEIAYGRLKRKTGNAPGIALTAAAIGSGVMLYTELWDSIEPTGGWSWEDVTFNTLGAGFSALRNSVPGLDRKLDFRLMIMPNSDIYTRQGKRHFEQQRHFFALKLGGFKAFENSPARFLELHAGYYAKDFTNEDRAAGIEPKRRIFVGVGLNLRELFFKNSRSRVGRAAGEALDYFQLPYTAIHHHVTN